MDEGKRTWLRQALGVDASGGTGDAAGGPGEAPTGSDDLVKDDGQDLADVASFLDDFRKKKDWGKVAVFLNGLKQSVLTEQLKTFSAAERGTLRETAIKDTTNLGPGSRIALALANVDHPVISPEQNGRAEEAVKKLSPDDQKKYKDMLDKTKGPKEKSYLTKGLAAGHSVAELEAFAAKIAGKDDQWMQDNLSLTGHSDGKGVRQQWSHSCGPTTFEAVMGELDPLYALKMVEENDKLTQVDNNDATKLNPKLAEDQRQILAGSPRGVAVNRASPGGRGMWITDNLNKMSASTGLKYENKHLDTDDEMNAGITKLNEALDRGEPVPIVVGTGPKAYNHYMLVTATDPGPPRYYTIHDPWDGKTHKRSEDQMKSKNLDFGDMGQLTALELPSKADAKPAAGGGS